MMALTDTQIVRFGPIADITKMFSCLNACLSSAEPDTNDTKQKRGDIRPIPTACRNKRGSERRLPSPKVKPRRKKKMNKQMTQAEIELVQQSCSYCDLWFTDARRSAMSVKERFAGLDKFDRLLGPNEGPYAPCPGIGAWAAPVTRLPISDKVTLVEVKSGPLRPLGVPAARALASVTMK
jgi:hypothetical protein